MTNWTDNQLDAIKKRGNKVLVSAAAGSGKTAVLTERVIKYILEGNNIDRLLIVTFTIAAAAEMKSRIKKRLLEEKQSDHIKNQLILIENAKITTMDAFYNELVKQNFYKLNILPNFNIMDDISSRVLSDKVIKDILENEFINNDFIYLLDTIGVNDVTLIKDIIEKISMFLDSKPFYKKVLNKILEDYKSNSFEESIWYNLLKDKLNDDINMYINIYESIISKLESYDKLYNQANTELSKLKSLLKLNNINELFLNIRNFNFDRLQTPRGFSEEQEVLKYKAIREDLKESIKELNKDITYITEEEYIEQSNISYKTLNKLFSIVINYKDKILEEKIKLNSFTFSDISNFALELLVDENNKKTELAETLSKDFDEILIDEYQDTNELQNIIFSAISKNSTNLFMVGDVKQSIYRFRKARPEIFINDKREAESNKNINVINLSTNFRSKKEIINFCNSLFREIMSEKVGDINYNKDEELVYGSNYNNDDKVEINIINKKVDIEDEDNYLTDVQKEAVYVADSIKKLIDSNYEIYDKRLDQNRYVKPSDIVLLFRSKDNMDIFRRALLKRNIDAYSENNELYFDNYEVKLIYAILQIIDNSYIDIPFVATLSSPLFNFTFDEIVEIRKINRFSSIYENLEQINTIKSKEFINKLDSYKEYSKTNSISSLISYIYQDLDYINIIQSIGNSDEKRKNSIQMIKYAQDYEKNFSSNLSNFIKYIQDITDNEIKVKGINPLPNETCVKLITIHSSKGLEYPVVYLVEAGKKFNFIDLYQDFLIDDDYGMAFRIKDKDLNIKMDTMQYICIKDELKNKAISEEIRILYVAITRAKEHLVITGTCANYDHLFEKASLKKIDNKISESYMKNTKSYLEQIAPSLNNKDISLNIISSAIIDEKEFEEELVEKEDKLDIDIEITDFNKIERNISVTNMKDQNIYIRKLESMDINKAEIGTLYHKLFELLEVKKYSEIELKESINKLVDKNIFQKEDISKLNINNIYKFYKSDIYNKLLESTYYKKEYEIFFEIDNILVDGIIDLVFIYDNIYYIIDYKSDIVNNISILKDRYIKQLELYEKAIIQKQSVNKVKKYIYSIYLSEFIEV